MTPNTLLRLISVAQHYELGSVMVDITNEVDVAVWFATHRFANGDIARGDHDERGVIYRFDKEVIEKFVRPRWKLGHETPAHFHLARSLERPGLSVSQTSQISTARMESAPSRKLAVVSSDSRTPQHI